MVCVSPLCHREVVDYLRKSGQAVRFIDDEPSLGAGVSSHPDLRICRLGGGFSDSAFCVAASELGGKYPDNARLCAVFLDKYMLHRLDITHPALLREAQRRGLICINVNQGYTKCSVTAVDGSAVISADPGIIAAAEKLPGIELLRVRAGHVLLPGFDTGFIGGASGRVGDEIVFNGSLSSHPDCGRIRDFIRARGLRVRDFPGLPLIDIGTITEYKELVK